MSSGLLTPRLDILLRPAAVLMSGDEGVEKNPAGQKKHEAARRGQEIPVHQAGGEKQQRAEDEQHPSPDLEPDVASVGRISHQAITVSEPSWIGKPQATAFRGGALQNPYKLPVNASIVFNHIHQ